MIIATDSSPDYRVWIMLLKLFHQLLLILQIINTSIHVNKQQLYLLFERKQSNGSQIRETQGPSRARILTPAWKLWCLRCAQYLEIEPGWRKFQIQSIPLSSTQIMSVIKTSKNTWQAIHTRMPDAGYAGTITRTKNASVCIPSLPLVKKAKDGDELAWKKDWLGLRKGMEIS